MQYAITGSYVDPPDNQERAVIEDLLTLLSQSPRQKVIGTFLQCGYAGKDVHKNIKHLRP